MEQGMDQEMDQEMGQGMEENKLDSGEGGFNMTPAGRQAEESTSPCAADKDKAADRDSSQKYHPTSQSHLLQPKDYNPLPTEVPPPIAAMAGNIGERHVLVLIGLPCRGKSFTAGRLARYLKFFHGADCRMFNVSDPKYCVEATKSPTESIEASANILRDQLFQFLGKEDQSCTRNMKPVAEMDDPRKKNVDSGRVAILYSSDAFRSFQERWSGTSKERRRWICEQVDQLREVRVKLIFLEVIVTDPELANSNILRRIHSSRQDKTLTELEVNEEKQRWERKILQYQRRYVTMQDDGSEDDLSYLKLINYGEKVITNKMHGYLPMRIVQFLSTIHTKPHCIYLTRHGQSEYNVLGKIGGNPPLSEAGKQYAMRLAQFSEEEITRGPTNEVVKARLWTSSLRRTIDTAAHIAHPILFEDKWQQMAPRVYRNLDEIFAGEYEGMTYAEIEAKHGNEASLRKMDKIGYRYPRGESYFDLIARLDALVHEMESYKEPLLVVAHQAVLRILYSYLMGVDREMAPKEEVPLHTVLKLTYDGWQHCTVSAIKLGPDVDPKLEQQKFL